MLPDGGTQPPHLAVHQRGVLIWRRDDREAGPVPDQPRPAPAEPLDATVVYRGLELIGIAGGLLDFGLEVAVGIAAPVRLHDLPEEGVVRVAAAVVANRGALVLRNQVEVVEHLLERLSVPLGTV